LEAASHAKHNLVMPKPLERFEPPKNPSREDPPDLDNATTFRQLNTGQLMGPSTLLRGQERSRQIESPEK